LTGFHTISGWIIRDVDNTHQIYLCMSNCAWWAPVVYC